MWANINASSGIRTLAFRRPKTDKTRRRIRLEIVYQYSNTVSVELLRGNSTNTYFSYQSPVPERYNLSIGIVEYHRHNYYP
jgi:hypothetical protein